MESKLFKHLILTGILFILPLGIISQNLPPMDTNTTTSTSKNEPVSNPVKPPCPDIVCFFWRNNTNFNNRPPTIEGLVEEIISAEINTALYIIQFIRSLVTKRSSIDNLPCTCSN